MAYKKNHKIIKTIGKIVNNIKYKTNLKDSVVTT